MSQEHKTPSCIFCLFSSDTEGIVNKIYEDEVCFVIADKFPLTKGHTLVIPKEHHNMIEDYTYEQQMHLHNILLKVNHALLKNNSKFKATNILLNNGKASGQHIPHTHWHIIPRKPYDKIIILFNLLTRFINPFNYIRTNTVNINIEK